MSRRVTLQDAPSAIACASSILTGGSPGKRGIPGRTGMVISIQPAPGGDGCRLTSATLGEGPSLVTYRRRIVAGGTARAAGGHRLERTARDLCGWRLPDRHHPARARDPDPGAWRERRPGDPQPVAVVPGVHHELPDDRDHMGGPPSALHRYSRNDLRLPVRKRPVADADRLCPLSNGGRGAPMVRGKGPGRSSHVAVRR